jgi:hypothetical protein
MPACKLVTALWGRVAASAGFMSMHPG